MPVSHTNCRDQIYFLHKGKTKTGKPRYWVSQKAEGNLLESIPEGYEIYERPGGMVFVRKIPKTPILPHELQCVQDQLTPLNDQLTASLESECGAYVRTLTAEAQRYLERMRSRFESEIRNKEIIIYEVSRGNGMPIMKFELFDEESREYLAYRWCFKGRIDDWMSIGSCGQLRDLAIKYCPTLGTDKFYELW
jgi:hypothetical protein